MNNMLAVKNRWIDRNSLVLDECLVNPGYCLLYTDSRNQEQRMIARIILKMTNPTIDSIFEMYINRKG